MLIALMTPRDDLVNTLFMFGVVGLCVAFGIVLAVFQARRQKRKRTAEAEEAHERAWQAERDLEASDWKEVAQGYVCERMVAFSIPLNGEVAVVSYEGTHTFHLDAAADITHFPDLVEGGDDFEREQNRLVLDGRQFTMLSPWGGEPLLESPQGEQLELDRSAEALNILARDGSTHLLYRFTDLSRDWGHATFSPDGQFILIGVPYDLYILARK